MAFVLVLIGLLMIVTGARGTYAQFGSQIAADFTGPGNFTWWIVSLGAVGSLGYIQQLQAFSRLFMTLIFAVFILSNRGFFNQLTAALKNGPVAPQASSGGSTQTSPGTGSLPTTTPSQAIQQGQAGVGVDWRPQWLKDWFGLK